MLLPSTTSPTILAIYPFSLTSLTKASALSLGRHTSNPPEVSADDPSISLKLWLTLSTYGNI